MLQLAGSSVETRADVPARPVAIGELLPVLQGLTNSIVDAAVARERREGREISCRAGCGACCSQIVPVADAEARALAELVSRMPAERRRAVEERFREALTRLDQAGLLARVRAASSLDREERHALGLEYFRAGVPCPFLEDESCSIHPDRPLACREYLVTSPAVECASPSAERVRMVRLPAKASSVLFRFGDGEGRDTPRFVPLVLALEWTAEHAADAQAVRPGPRLLEAFVRDLAR